jgi:hypothetical protein
VSQSQVAYLDLLIKHHHQLLLSLAPEDFTPKCHFLTHYPRMILLYGPLRHVWCMRFEGYHQYLKSIAQRTGNFKNICFTLANRNQLKKCAEQVSDCCLIPDEVIVGNQTEISVRSLPLSLQDLVMNHFACSRYSVITSLTAVTLEAVHYSANSCMLLDILDDVPVFVLISHILTYDRIWGIAGKLVTCHVNNFPLITMHTS